MVRLNKEFGTSTPIGEVFDSTTHYGFICLRYLVFPCTQSVSSFWQIIYVIEPRMGQVRELWSIPPRTPLMVNRANILTS